MLNLQQIFSKGLAHLRAQGRPAYSHNSGQCFYRAMDGTKCFIGGLIPDDKYEERFEGTSAAGVRRAFDAAPDIEDNILNDLQRCLHDNPAAEADVHDEDFMELVEAAAQDFAAEHNLEYRHD